MRGEYRIDSNSVFTASELPPRARRIPLETISEISAEGTTSACAENTPGAIRGIERIRNYLRVRGEYGGEWDSVPVIPELPPRARRIRDDASQTIMDIGTTSACAENTRHGIRCG